MSDAYQRPPARDIRVPTIISDLREMGYTVLPPEPVVKREAEALLTAAEAADSGAWIAAEMRAVAQGILDAEAAGDSFRMHFREGMLAALTSPRMLLRLLNHLEAGNP